MPLSSPPCDSSRSGCWMAPTCIASSRPSRSRSGSVGGGRGSASACPACMPGSGSARRSPGRAAPRCRGRPGRPGSGRSTTGRARTRGWSPRVAPRRAGRARIPVTIHRTSEPGLWVVAYPWREDGRAQAIAEAALRLVDLDLDPRTTRPATRRTSGRRGRSRTLTRALRSDPRRRHRRARLDPGRRPPRCPTISISGTNGKTTTTRMISHILRVGRPPRRHDHVGRRPVRRRSWWRPAT